jgi:hypothetical protein
MNSVFPDDSSLPPYLKLRRPPLEWVKSFRDNVKQDYWIFYNPVRGQGWSIWSKGKRNKKWQQIARLGGRSILLDRVCATIRQRLELQEDMRQLEKAWYAAEQKEREAYLDEFQNRTKVWWGQTGASGLYFPEDPKYFFMGD